MKNIKTEILEFNDNKYILNIYEEKRRDSRVSIGKKGINIRLSLFLSREDRFQQILKFKSWIKERLNKEPNLLKKDEFKDYNDDDLIKIFNDEYRIKIFFANKNNSSVKLNDNDIIFKISDRITQDDKNKYISKLLSKIMAKKYFPKLEQKINYLNKKHFNQNINKIYFKNTKSKWGSCSTLNNINISSRLLFAPEDVLDYVIIHELAHLVQHNHSKKFWILVGKAMPNYKEKKLWLKQNGGLCKF